MNLIIQLTVIMLKFLALIAASNQAKLVKIIYLSEIDVFLVSSDWAVGSYQYCY